MGYFKSSVALDATADEAFRFLNSEEHLRAFVLTVEPDETFVDPDGGPTGDDWFHVGAVRHRRLDWHAGHSRGYVEVIHRGDASDLVAEVHTSTDDAGLDARLDAALFEVQAVVDGLQAAPSRVARPEDSASFVVETVLKGLRRHLPVSLRPELTGYLDRAATLDGSADREAARAALCRSWADGLAAADHDGWGRRVADFVEHVRHGTAAVDETLVGAEGVTAREVDSEGQRAHFGSGITGGAAALDPDAVPDGFRRELDESDEAVSEAAAAAAHRGWESVPWKALLDSLFSV